MTIKKFIVRGYYRGVHAVLFSSDSLGDCEKFVKHYEDDSRFAELVTYSEIETRNNISV